LERDDVDININFDIKSIVKAAVVKAAVAKAAVAIAAILFKANLILN
jgi:hypothetical protein